MDGFIVIDKPAGITSHDVVSAVRRSARLKRVGHTGTLDPFATGVLPVALGEGTKAIPFLDELRKAYRAVMRLGESTDTQDCTGRTVHRGEWNGLTACSVEEAFAAFLGPGLQVPPMFSALKRGGEPLYKLARRGEEVHREPRPIEIFSLEIERVDLPDVVFSVTCSRGTYIRTLASDLGDRLGCGAHLTGLRRTASGPFCAEQAISLETLVGAAQEGKVAEYLVSSNAALSSMPTLELTEKGTSRVGHGIAPTETDIENHHGTKLAPGDRVRLCRRGVLMAIAENGTGQWPEEVENLRLLRVFNAH